MIVDTVVTDTDVHGHDTVLGRFHLLTEDGKPVLIPVGDRRYTLSPQLRGVHTVDLAQTMTHSDYSGKDTTLGPYQQNTPLGKSYKISLGSVTYSTKVSRSR